MYIFIDWILSDLSNTFWTFTRTRKCKLQFFFFFWFSCHNIFNIKLPPVLFWGYNVFKNIFFPFQIIYLTIFISVASVINLFCLLLASVYGWNHEENFCSFLWWPVNAVDWDFYTDVDWNSMTWAWLILFEGIWRDFFFWCSYQKC